MKQHSAQVGNFLRVGHIWLADLMERKTEAQKVIPKPFHFNNILLHRALKRCSRR